MKKIITMLTCLALLLCTSCSKGSYEPTVEEPPTEQTTEEAGGEKEAGGN